MNLLEELKQEVNYNDNRISILELFIKDSKYFYYYCYLYPINQITRLFLVSHEAELIFAYYSSTTQSEKHIKIRQIISNFDYSYYLLLSVGFSFQDILKYTYLEFYDISNIIEDIHNKKYFWRRISDKSGKKLLACSNEKTICFIKKNDIYIFRHDFTNITIPNYLFKYVYTYIEKTNKISHKKILISGMLYRSEKDKIKYLEQKKKHAENKKKRNEQLKLAQEIKGKQESKIPPIKENKKETLSYVHHNNNVRRETKPSNNCKQNHKLSSNDFIIRCAIFKCSIRQHKIDDIDASIDIINITTNDIVSIIIPAGYCSNCNKYFIMDSTYRNIFSKGLPLCKIINEKIYSGYSKNISSKWGSEESILRQYGYNVSSIDDISSTRRQKILAVIIDTEVLTKVEIMGYLKYFIRIHQTDSRFIKAIEKWTNDLEFVSEYNKGHYTTYKVSGLKKNW